MNLRTTLILLLAAAASLVAYSTTLPELKAGWTFERLYRASGSMPHSRYCELEAKMRTGRNFYMDLGGGIATLFGLMLMFCVWKKIRTTKDLANTLGLGRNAVFIGSNLAWLAMIPGTHWYYFFRAARGDYAPFADSIAIPISTQIPVFVLALLPLNFFLAVMTSRVQLPAKLFPEARAENFRTTFWNLFYAVCLMFNVLTIVAFAIDGDHFSIAIALFFSYVLLSLLAGHLSDSDLVS